MDNYIIIREHPHFFCYVNVDYGKSFFFFKVTVNNIKYKFNIKNPLWDLDLCKSSKNVYVNNI